LNDRKGVAKIASAFHPVESNPIESNRDLICPNSIRFRSHWILHGPTTHCHQDLNNAVRFYLIIDQVVKNENIDDSELDMIWSCSEMAKFHHVRNTMGHNYDDDIHVSQLIDFSDEEK
jgi:hypothetical protein